ncbi:DUF91 domain-containing protein [Salmonella enterica subsp. enterica serovar Mbandaka]|uniref:DUF91 domain-containing protein n=1 Tax=Salmonella enterica subsp. enterica serovar Mbandaka TaxID=192954 RepID=A0A608D7X0_SALET|nr:DUF91 domain-containing protein [Salmonella enterica subsp. enterica serovar Mbandaka]ECV0695805.1 DUF91 domain-containing protein [Salmonella enterica subsp. enterica serovar Mbandaka]ECV0873217.1 DUF91 domain-containing protein [Salmonella enterica subsp. enterica serovar Mbandaka]ECV0997873.1 DUF91 domain-containing protein [Salmonella enterica subsp. enterica serovar Mbandaka]
MSDIQLFRLGGGKVQELPGKAAAIEKDLQMLIESHMETFLGVRFLETEYHTGKTHRGRIDSLGLDENNCPVIIEYKRHSNENVINQGLFYLDWLLDHKAEFQLLVMEKISKTAAKAIDWSGTRLICIAADFNKYDEHAVQQINRNINLIRYKLFADDLLMLELVNAVVENSPQYIIANGSVSSGKRYTRTQREQLSSASPALLSLYEQLKSYVLSLSDEVQFKELKLYDAFHLIRNFLCVAVYPVTDPHLRLWLKINPQHIQLEEGFSRDVTHIGHWGTGDVELIVRNEHDLDKAKLLIEKAWQEN